MATLSAHGAGAQTQTGGWWILSNSSGAKTKFAIVQSQNTPKQTPSWPNAPIGPFSSQKAAQQVVATAQKEGGFGIQPSGKGSSTGTNLKNAGGSAVSWFQEATGGILAAALEQGFIQIIKDLWAVVVGPLEVIAGAFIIIATLVIFFKEDIAQVATMVAMAG